MAGRIGGKSRGKSKTPDNVVDLKTGQAAASDRKVSTEDNLTPEQKQAKADEADKVALLSVLGQLRLLQVEIDKAAVPFKAAKDAYTQKMRDAKASGFLRYELEELLKDTSDDESTRSLTDKEMRRARLREFCGLPVGDRGVQEKLALLPTMERDKAYWRTEGKRLGLAGHTAKPEPGMAQEFHNTFMEGWHEGQAERIIENIKPLPKAKPAAPVEPEPSIADQRLAEQRQINAAKAGLETLTGAEGDDTLPADGGEPIL